MRNRPSATRVTRAATDFRFILPTDVSRQMVSSPRFSLADGHIVTCHEAVQIFAVMYFDAVNPLHPCHAVPAGHNQSYGAAVGLRERLAIEFVAEHHVALFGILEGQAAREILRLVGVTDLFRAGIGCEEDHLNTGG